MDMNLVRDALLKEGTEEKTLKNQEKVVDLYGR